MNEQRVSQGTGQVMTLPRSEEDVINELEKEFETKSRNDILWALFQSRLQVSSLLEGFELGSTQPTQWLVEDPRTGKKRLCTGEQMAMQIKLLEMSVMALMHHRDHYKKLSGSRMQQIKLLKGKLKDAQIVAEQLQHESHGGSVHTGPMYKDAAGA